MQYAAAVRVSEHYGLREHASYDDQSALAVAYRHYATFNAEVGRDKLADENFAKAARLYPPLREAYKHDKFVSEKYNKPEGWLMARWGEHQYQVGDRDGARKSAARAVELLSPIMNKPKEWNWYRGLAGIAHKTLAQVALVEGDVAGWDREMAEALKLAREVVREEPGIADTQTELATLLRVRGEGLAGLEGRAAEVDATLDEAVRLIDEINTKYTEKDGYRQVKVRAEILLARGRWLARSNRLEKAEADLVEAHRLARHLAEDLEKEIYPPTSQTFPGLLGRAEAALGRLEVRQGKAEEGRALLLKAGSHLGEACKKRPKSVEDRRELDELMRDPR
jgi:tetratricopeptide (TPR) repeat protein